MQRILVVLVAAALTLVVAIPALATHELGHEDTGQVAAQRAEVLPPGYTTEADLYVWEYGYVPLYGLTAICYNQGGYWYWQGGYYYWHAC